MQTVYLVRHGETEANVARTWQGADDELSPQGKEQAKQLAQRLEGIPFDEAFSSNMVRARDTTTAIMKQRTIPLTYTTALAERRVPSSTVGVALERVPENPCHQFLVAWEAANRDPDFRYEDEETVRELVERAGDALQLFRESEVPNIVAVTHGTILRTIINIVLQGGDTTDPYTIFSAGRHMVTTNTGLSVITREADEAPWQLLTYNDHAHFADN
jgi:broad specificity phosphatase PhoE